MGFVAFAFMGLSLGLLGGGGAILTVPILVYLLGVPPQQATAYSLFLVGATALAGGLIYLRRGQVDFRTGLTFAVPSFVSVYTARAFILPSIPDPILQTPAFALSKSMLIMILFSIVMVAASASMIRSRGPSAPIELKDRPNSMRILSQGILVGSLSGFVGAGGGFLIVPALSLLIGMEMKTAIGTSLFIIAANSLIGFIGDLQNGNPVPWMMLLEILAIALSGLGVGTWLSIRFPAQALKTIFGYFVLIMGAGVLIDQLHRLY